VLRCRWCYIIVPNAHAPPEDKRDDSKDSFYVELEPVFSHFPHNHTEIVLGDFNAKMGREDIFKLTTGNEFT
jgi:exonuclease III